VGSSSTSLSSMIRQKIDIDTPQPFLLDFHDNDNVFDAVGFKPDEKIVKIAFKMEIGNLIDSEIMQILPTEFAVEIVKQLKSDISGEPAPPKPQPAAPAQQAPQPSPPPPQSAPQQEMPMGTTAQSYAPPPEPQAAPAYAYPPQQTYQAPYPQPPPAQPVNVQPAQFQSFDVGGVMQQKENMGIIMDVPLDITVELGRTRKKIQEILEFSPGTIIDLDKLAGEPIDILVNGKFVAKGEVVVIDENFGIRITDIISVDKRI